MIDASSPTLSWSVWPARERPLVALAGAAAIVCFAAAAGLFANNAIVGVAVGLALAVVVQRFYYPVRCTLTATSATVRTLLSVRTMPLAIVRHVAHNERAMLLSSGSANALSFAASLVMPLPKDAANALRPSVFDHLERCGVATEAVA